jgi:hypothetical protein
VIAIAALGITSVIVGLVGAMAICETTVAYIEVYDLNSLSLSFSVDMCQQHHFFWPLPLSHSRRHIFYFLFKNAYNLLLFFTTLSGKVGCRELCTDQEVALFEVQLLS